MTGYKHLLVCAERAIPFLVAYAQAGKLTTYSQVSEATNLHTPRLGNRSFGVIGETRSLLASNPSFAWRGGGLPDLTAIAVKKGTLMSGDGAFHANRALLDQSSEMRLRDLEFRRQEVFGYPYWGRYLNVLGLSAWEDLTPESLGLGRFEPKSGESELHRAVKTYVATHPECVVEVRGGNSSVETEFVFASSDRMDVSFRGTSTWIGVEVKTSAANPDELIKGLFQTAKYRALMVATARMRAEVCKIDVILALGGSPSPELLQLAERLDICLVANIESKMKS